VAGTTALSLNFVLVVFFVVVVTLMSFGFGIAAISELSQWRENGNYIMDLTPGWFFKSMLPAMLTLALVDVTAYIAVRIRSFVSAA
jgi:hypothetical protein